MPIRRITHRRLNVKLLPVCRAQQFQVKRAASASRYDDDLSKLKEVMVKAECLGEAKLLHDPFAGAIRKAPVLIIVATKYFPCF